MKKKNPHAVALGKLGGKKGGKAKAQQMTKEERSAAMQKAARARWANRKEMAMKTLIVLVLLCGWSISLASGQSIQHFSTVDPLTGHVQTGTVLTQPDSSQTYMWNNSLGRSRTDTGYVAPPIRNTYNFSTYDGDTGKSSVGSLRGLDEELDRPFLPSAPTWSTPYGGESSVDR